MLQEHELRVTQKKYGKNNSLFYFDSQNANLPRVFVLCFYCVTGDSVYNICLTSIRTVLFLMEQFLLFQWSQFLLEYYNRSQTFRQLLRFTSFLDL